MGDRIEIITSQMSEAAADARTAFGSLSDKQLNWKPAAESWSIAQCLDHLIRTDSLFEPEFNKLATGTRKNTFWQSWSPLTSWFGSFLIRTIDNDSKKVKAPSRDIVPPSDIEPGIVARYGEHIAGVNLGIHASCGAVDLRKTVMSSPFFGLFTYTLDDALAILVGHHRRHLRQAKRVAENEGFPK